MGTVLFFFPFCVPYWQNTLETSAAFASLTSFFHASGGDIYNNNDVL